MICRKKFKSFLLFGALILLPSMAMSAVMDNYCSVPPYLSTVVTPNILIVLDNSGSMNGQAYAGSYNPVQFASGKYYGYFDADRCYQYTNNGRWETIGAIDAGGAGTGCAAFLASATTSNPVGSGNFLNWATMRRVDVSKKLLIGGKASPRSPSATVTVKLYGENSSSSWDFDKDHDNTTEPGLIYPFSGNYRYSMSGDTLSIIPVTSGIQTEIRRPTNDITNGAWSPDSGTTNWTQVDEASADGDTTFIQNTTSNTNDQVILNYDKSAFAISGTITDVTIFVRAKKTSSGTMRIRGVVRVKDNASIEADFTSNYDNLSTSYDTYQYSWDKNPQTLLPWTWDDLTTSGINSLTGFGVKAETLPTTSRHPHVTQIYMMVTVSNPTGGPYNLIVDQGMVKATGLIDNLSSAVKFGLTFYNTSEGAHVDNYVDFGAATNMVTSIQNMSPSTWTPLAETLYEMVRYFRQDTPYYSVSPADFQTGLNYDPYYYQYTKLAGSGLPDQYVPCSKSFVLFLTDGESTQDQNIPGTGSGACSLTNVKGCSAGYRFAGTAVGTTYASNGTDYMIDVAFWARTADSRPGTCTSTPTAWQQCIPLNQNIVLYSVFMFGKGSTLLKDAAIDGGFTDLNGDNRPGPDLKEYLRDSNEDGVLNSSDLPLTYYEGDDGYELEASITNAIANILRRAASGTAVSVLTTSSRGVGSIVQAYFLPIKQEGVREVTWTGYMQNLWIDPKDYLREDTTNDQKLILDSAGRGDGDRVVKLYFDFAANETKAATFTTDANGDGGTLAACTPSETKPFSDVTYLWEGGKKLALKNPSERKLFTSTKVLKTLGTTNFTTGICGTLTSSVNCFTAANVTGNPTMDSALDPDATYTSGNIVRYTRGECLETGATDDAACTSTANATYRDRRVTVSGGAANGNVWKLGDIISSTPKVLANTFLNPYHIDYGDATYYNFISSDSYRHRSSIAFVGANDGVLHAFRVGYLKDTTDANGPLESWVKALFRNLFSSADTEKNLLGEEVWGYIPFNSFPYLKYLANPSYCHIYFNDLSVRLVDASLGGSTNPNPTDAKTTGSWKTILIGGMRFGGSCSGGTPALPLADVGFSSYFAIDVTDPENPVPLWEFSDNELGYSATFPSIIRTGDPAQNGNWYVAVGSGSTTLPKTGVDIARSTPGYVYLLNMKTGEIAKKIQISLTNNTIVGDILAIDANKDYKVEKIYFGGTDKRGLTWYGNLWNMAIPDQDLSPPAAWTPVITRMFDSANKYFTASPDAAKDADGNIWVYAGSGKFFSSVDQIDISQQIFMGLKDSTTISYPIDLVADMDNRTATNTTGTVTGTRTVCTYDSGTGAFANQTIVTSINPTSALPSASLKGWYINLSTSPTGERVITRPLAVGGLVDFLTYAPNSDPCSYGGNSYLYAVGYTTGVAPVSVAILSAATTGGVTTGIVTVSKGVLLGPGAPPTGEAIIIPPPKPGEEELRKKIQIATGVIIEATNQRVTPVISKIVHWLKK